MKKKLSISTDNNGNFRVSEIIDLPTIPWPHTNVDIKARLNNPPGTTIKGTIDIDAVDGSPNNPSKPFALKHEDEYEYIGKFAHGGGGEKFKVTVSGTTSPTKPNIVLSVEIEAW